MYLRIGDWSSTSRVSPFGYQGIYACLRLPLAFRSLPRPSSALGALASTLCSCSLDYVDPETRYSNFRSIDFLLLQLVFQDFLSRLSLCAVVKVRPEHKLWKVGRSGLEPPTSRLSGGCSNRLS